MKHIPERINTTDDLLDWVWYLIAGKPHEPLFVKRRVLFFDEDGTVRYSVRVGEVEIMRVSTDRSKPGLPYRHDPTDLTLADLRPETMTWVVYRTVMAALKQELGWPESDCSTATVIEGLLSVVAELEKSIQADMPVFSNDVK